MPADGAAFEDWEGPERRERAPGDVDAEALVLDLDGFEGPLDVLLTLARAQKVDLRKVSVAALADQYLVFVAEARRLRLELAADYLVMAAWLAYLKSRLLLPDPPADEGPTGEEMAARLAERLERLEAMRKAAARLMALPRLGQDRFVRGQVETVHVHRRVVWTATLSDLLGAYGSVRTRDEYRPLQAHRPDVYAIDAALERLAAAMGAVPGWTELARCLPEDWRATPGRARAAMAACFAASLELAKGGKVEIAQDHGFGPIRIRQREALMPDPEPVEAAT